MAAKAPVTITKEGHTKERPQEDFQVLSRREPSAVAIIGFRFTLAQEEKWVEQHRGSTLRVVTPITTVDNQIRYGRSVSILLEGLNRLPLSSRT